MKVILNERYKRFLNKERSFFGEGVGKLSPNHVLIRLEELKLINYVVTVTDGDRHSTTNGIDIVGAHQLTFEDGSGTVVFHLTEDGAFSVTHPTHEVLSHPNIVNATEYFGIGHLHADRLKKCFYNFAKGLSDPASAPEDQGIELDRPVKAHIVYQKEIVVSHAEAKEAEDILGLESGVHPDFEDDETIRTYSTSFYTPFGVYVVEFLLCNGDTPFVEPVLFEVSADRGKTIKHVLDVHESLLGDYVFEINEPDKTLVFQVSIVANERILWRCAP